MPKANFDISTASGIKNGTTIVKCALISYT